MNAAPSKAQFRRWEARAETLHQKASKLYGDMKAELGNDDTDLMPLVGDTLCSAAELANNLEARGS